MATDESTPDVRKRQFVEACIAGIHAHQILLHRERHQGDDAAFAFTGADSVLQALATHFIELAATRPADAAAWVQDGRSDTPAGGECDSHVRGLLRARLALAEGLPVNVLARHLRRLAHGNPETNIRAVASLYQLVFQETLDAEAVQQLFPLYMALGLPVSLEELGIDYDRDEFIAMGKTLAPQCVACPFDVSADIWHLVSRKIKNWSERFRGKVTAATYAKELLALPEIRDCAGAIRAMQPQKFCVLGHSFTMSMHWASQGSFTDIAYEILHYHNPGIEWVRVNRGGLTPTLARRDYLETVMRHHPDTTIMVTISRNEENRSDLAYCIQQLRNRGSSVITFDCPMVYPEIAEKEMIASAVAREAGASVVEVYPLFAKQPLFAEFAALDAVHTTPPYHKFMATELIRFIAGKRQAALPA